VLDELGELVSVVTDRDVCMGAFLQGVSLPQARVEGVMSRRLVTCSPDADVSHIAAKLRREQLRRLPVLGHDGHLVGVVTLSDVVRGLERELEQAERLVRSTYPGRDDAEAAADAVEKARAIYQSCSRALEATGTMAKIADPRAESGELFEVGGMLEPSELSYYRNHDGDDVWIYE
jgi:predicted transcriptional regulator